MSKKAEEISRHLRGTVSLARNEDEAKPSRVIRGTAVVFDQPTEIYNDGELCIRETISRQSVTQELLDGSDIRMTIDHIRSRLLARSKSGKGTLKYKLTEKGVEFEFEAAHTPDGDTAFEMVSRGDIDGCSFYACAYPEDIEVKRSKEGDLYVVERNVKRFCEFHDFCITADPAFPQTAVDVARSAIKEEEAEAEKAKAAEETEAMKRSWEAWEKEAEILRK